MRDVAGPATHGQRYIWDIIKSLEPDNEHLNIGLVQEASPGMGVDAATRVLRRLWSRHESFRTGFSPDPSGVLRQDVRRHVEFPIEIWRADADPPEEEVYEALSGLFTRRFDVSQHAQARGAIVTHGSQVRWLVLSLSHMVADAWTTGLLYRELRELVAGRELRPAEDLVHPFDHKSFELSARGRRANDAAQQYWLRSLRDFPNAYLGEGTRPPERPRYRLVTMRSATAFAAARSAAARLRASPATIMTAVFAELVGTLSGISPVPFLIRTNNRGRRGLRESVGHYAQAAPVLVDRPVADMPAVFGRLLMAERHGSYDPLELAGRLREAWPHVPERPALTMTINHIPSPDGAAADHADHADQADQDDQADKAGHAGHAGHAGPLDEEPVVDILGGGRDEEKISIYCDVALALSRMTLFVDTAYISSHDAAERLRGVHGRLMEMGRTG